MVRPRQEFLNVSYLFIYLSICLSIFLASYLSNYLSSYLSVYEAVLPINAKAVVKSETD